MFEYNGDNDAIRIVRKMIVYWKNENMKVRNLLRMRLGFGMHCSNNALNH